MFKALIFPLLLATFTAGQNVSDIYTPSSDVWWVANSENSMSWDCKNSQAIAVGNFTVLINSPSFVAPLAIIPSMQANADCNKTITQDQANQPPGTNYTILFANSLSNNQVYAISEPFEIKPFGSQYPSPVSSSAPAASASAASA